MNSLLPSDRGLFGCLNIILHCLYSCKGLHIETANLGFDNIVCRAKNKKASLPSLHAKT